MPGLLRSNLSVVTGTAISRITGLGRIAVVGAVLGSPSALADAYDIANSTPNMIYELLIGGILSSSLVPLFTHLDEERDIEGRNAVLGVSMVVLAVVTIISMLAAPLIFRLYSLLTADGIDADLYRRVGVLLARLFLAQIFFYGVTALLTAMLHSRERFFAAAWAPATGNIVVIVMLLLVPRVTDIDVPTLTDVVENTTLRWMLGGGATLGVVAGAVGLVPTIVRTGISLRPRINFRHPAVRRLGSLSGWAVGYVASNQLTIIVIRNLLRGGDGSIFAYSRAYLWFVLPHGLLAVSITTTLMPRMSRAHARGEPTELVRHAANGIRLVALVTVPASVALFILRRPIIGAAFEHGNVTSSDALDTSRALAGLSIGLAAFSIYLFTIRVFFAQRDARTPFVLNAIENLINIVLAFALVDRFGLLGMGLAFAIAYLLSAAISMVVLERRVPEFPFAATLAGLSRMVVAGAVMAACTWPVARTVGANTGVDAVVRIVAAGACGAVAYVAALTALRSPELKALRSLRRG